MNFVALIGIITNIEIVNNNKILDIKVMSKFGKNEIAKIYFNIKDVSNDLELGNIIGINGIIDFSDNNRIIVNNFTKI